MGRIGRKKRLKACDPFSSRKSDPLAGLPPSLLKKMKRYDQAPDEHKSKKKRKRRQGNNAAGETNQDNTNNNNNINININNNNNRKYNNYSNNVNNKAKKRKRSQPSDSSAPTNNSSKEVVQSSSAERLPGESFKSYVQRINMHAQSLMKQPQQQQQQSQGTNEPSDIAQSEDAAAAADTPVPARKRERRERVDTKRRPGESHQSYIKRIREDAEKLRNKQQQNVKKSGAKYSAKRKQFLDNKRNKRKAAADEDLSDEEFPSAAPVRFGAVNYAPPALPTPRMTKKMKQRMEEQRQQRADTATTQQKKQQLEMMRDKVRQAYKQAKSKKRQGLLSKTSTYL